MKEDGLEIMGAPQPLPLRFDALCKTIGQPNRTFKGINLVHTWDDLGVLAYQAKGSEDVKELTLAFGDEDKNDFWPKSTFKGAVAFSNHVVSPNWGRKELRSAGFETVQLFPDFFDNNVGKTRISVHLDRKTHSKPVSVHLDFSRFKE